MHPVTKFVYYTLQVVLGIPCSILAVLGYRKPMNWLIGILDWFIRNEGR